jgi:CheY-like chemotaxis protein/HPt (histidine-containing phosphotransfer) domain-containing protein
VALLRQLRIEAEVAPSAEAALVRCRAQAFALFFLDRDLPGISGLELARELRRQEAGERRAVIIATTGADTLPARSECLGAGMDGFIAKPVTLETLRAALGEWFGRRPGESRVRLPLGRGRPREPWRLDTLRYMANGDDRELARRTRRYVRELDEYLTELQGAMEVTDFGRLRRGAHRLVAHLSIIEHAALVSAAQQIEESAVNRDRDGVSAKWIEVLSLARQVKIRLVADAESAPSE